MATSTPSSSTADASSAPAADMPAKVAAGFVNVPQPAAEPELNAGPGQTVVTSPTGTRSVVDDAAVDLLKTQGYTTR